MSEWISMKEKMPPRDTWVVVRGEDGGPIVTKFLSIEAARLEEKAPALIDPYIYQYWMLLPDPPKPEGPFRVDKLFSTWGLIYNDGVRDWRIGLYGINEEAAKALPNWLNDRLPDK